MAATTEWTASFDKLLKERYRISIEDAGLDQVDLDLRSDESPEDAVERFANDYGLERADWPWG